MTKNDNGLTFDGIVVGVERTFYLVEVSDVPALEGNPIRGMLSGKMRMNKIRVIVGDKVSIKLDPYDLSKGRIVYRKKI